MFQYVIRRLIWAVVMAILVVGLTFSIFFVLPGGLARRVDGRCGSMPLAVMMAGRNPRPELVCSIEKRLGLDRPVYVQFARYLDRLAHGDLGYSYHSHEPVRDAIFRRFPATASLAIGASIMWLVMGVLVGIVSALRRRTLWDRVSMITALIFLSMPTFFLGLVAVFFLGGNLHIYKVAGYRPLTEDPVAWLQALWLPWLVLAITDAAIYARMVRGNLLEVQDEDYIRTARAKGLPEHSVTRHALRTALTPVVTMYGMDLGTLLGGAIITESIFNIPGIGRLAVEAITAQNVPVILGTTLVAALAVVIANVVVDIAYAWLDPRVVYS